jgi:1,4-dihydroxy-2-naphthoate octaprenyltransferase
VGLAAAALSFLSFGPELTLDYALYITFILFSSTSAYNYMHWVKSLNTYREKKENEEGASSIDWASFSLAFFAGIPSIALLFFLGSLTLLYYLFPALLIALIYPLAFPHPNRAFSSLRRIPGLKLFLIAGSWTYLTFAIPFWMQGAVDKGFFAGEFIFRTILIMGLTIPFDLRDIAKDEPSMRTVPQVFGPANAIALSILALFSYQIWVLLQFFFFGQNWALSLALFLAIEIGIRMIRALETNRSEFQVNFWIESVPIIMLIFSQIAYLVSSIS